MPINSARKFSCHIKRARQVMQARMLLTYTTCRSSFLNLFDLGKWNTEWRQNGLIGSASDSFCFCLFQREKKASLAQNKKKEKKIRRIWGYLLVPDVSYIGLATPLIILGKTKLLSSQGNNLQQYYCSKFRIFLCKKKEKRMIPRMRMLKYKVIVWDYVKCFRKFMTGCSL
jgi:hypothetical protein